MTPLIATLAAYIPLALLRGWVIALLWGWYVTDYFGARPLTIVEAVGLGILASLFTPSGPDDSDEEGWWIKSILRALINPILALAFGFAWSFLR